MRIFFIPGLGEEKWIFDKIESSIAGEKVFIDNWDLLRELDERNLNALVYADFVIERFNITATDLVIGHSLGGWVAFQIKSRINCPIIQIASFTNAAKAFKPAPSRLIYVFAKNGWGLNSFVLNLLIFFKYRNKPSKAVLKRIFERIMSGDKTVLVKQLKVVYEPTNPAVNIFPELRLHAEKDDIVTPPDETFTKTPGDHFALYTYPNTVYTPINELLKQQSKSEGEPDLQKL